MTTAPSLRAFRRAPAIVAAQPVAQSARWSYGWLYFVAVIATWCFIPLLRRLLDWHNGFYNPVQVTSTIPYVVTIPFVFFCFRPERLKRLTPAFKLFAWIWLAVFAYALIVAVFVGNTYAGIYEAVQYLVPMLVGIWLAGDEIENPKLMQRLSSVMLAFGAVVAVYGLAQYVSPPPWDALWLEGGRFESMGVAEPFRIRIFSTLNSTGPAADFFAVTIILALPFFELKRLWVWPFVGVVGAALLLTLVRSSWIVLLVGVTVYLCFSPRRFRAIPFIAIYGVLLSFLIASLPALLGAGGESDIVTARIASLSDVGHDDSALTRADEIRESLQQGLENAVGLGLGQIGASSALGSNPETPRGNTLDSGYMARLLELGWLGFAGYLFVVVGSLCVMVTSAFRPNNGRLRPRHEGLAIIVATATALCAALAWADASGDSHLGIDGLLFWIAMGIGFRRAPPENESSAPSKPKFGRMAMRREATGSASR